jgi:hypothetical protein
MMVDDERARCNEYNGGEYVEQGVHPTVDVQLTRQQIWSAPSWRVTRAGNQVGGCPLCHFGNASFVRGVDVLTVVVVVTIINIHRVMFVLRSYAPGVSSVASSVIRQRCAACGSEGCEKQGRLLI